MTTRRARRLWATVFLMASASLVSTGVALPALDRDLYAVGEVIEAEHQAGTCAVAHNHALCMVWAGSQFYGPIGHSSAPADPGVLARAAESVDLLHPRTEGFPTRSRAPPAL